MPEDFDVSVAVNKMDANILSPYPTLIAEHENNSRNHTLKRKSRWGDPNHKVVVPGFRTTNLCRRQLDSYMIHMRIDEVNRKLRMGDIYPPEGLRSPSPEPVYDERGKKVNVREQRYRKRYEDERTRLIGEALKCNPTFRPPAEFKKGSKYAEKVYIPSAEYPEINFIGLLIGPRGNTLKKMENETGAKISIRGKGSLKEGKMLTEMNMESMDEELHCMVTADSQVGLDKCIKMINKIVETACTIPENENELKKIQLRELAQLNGTLKDSEQIYCTNCGGTGHRKYECTERKNFTVNLVCSLCGGAGHISRDCIHKDNPDIISASKEKATQMTNDYLSFLAELGEAEQK